MKYVKLFLASSVVEFETQRRELGDYIRSLNDIYIKRGIYFELTLCEDLSNAVARERKQAEYNRMIRESQYFYVLFGRHAGEYTVEEFDVALESFRAMGAPRIYTYFLTLPEGDRPEASVTRFMERLDKEIGHYYSMFTHMDAVKLNMLLEFARDASVHSEVRFEDGQALLDNQPFLSLRNIPIYSKNEAVQQLTAEKTRLDNEFAALAVEYGKKPDAGLLGELMRLGEQRTKTADQLHQLEMDVLGLCNQAAEKRKLGQVLNWREKKAMDLVDQGDYEGAKAILRDAQWEQELRHAEETAEAAKAPIREYISGKRTLISTLKATGLNTETVPEITALYENLILLAEKHQIELDVLYDYALFLCDQCQSPHAIAVAERLKFYWEGPTAAVDEGDRAILFNLLGILYSDNHDYGRAEQIYREALKIRRRLTEKNSGAYELDLAHSCNNLAILLDKNGQTQEAESLHWEALEIYRRIAAKDPDAYESFLAMSCNNLALLLENNSQTKEAETLHREALEIRRRLAEKNSGAYEPDLAMSCNNLANLLADVGQTKEAEALHREALEIRRRLAEKNPGAYEPDLATSCNNLANLLADVGQTKEAETLYREAQEIFRRLAEMNPNAYEPDLATSCNNLANLLADVGQTKEAEALHREALEIRRWLAEKNPDAYEPDLSKTCYNLANLLADVGQTREAEVLHREALENFRRLAEKNPSAYELNVAISCNNLANLLADAGQTKEVEALRREAQEIFRRLAKRNPDAYETYLAASCYNLAILLQNHSQIKEAEVLHREALAIYRRLAEKNPGAYELKLVMSCNNLAILLAGIGQTEEGEALHREALEIFRRLLEEDARN